MWKKTFSKIYQGVSLEQVWAAYTDIENWPKWDSSLDYCAMDGEFADGETFDLKLKDGPNFKIYLYDIIPLRAFSDYCKFFGAKMHDVHTFTAVPGGVQVTNTTSVSGVLSFLWVRLVAKDVAAGVPAQTDSMISYIKQRNNIQS